MKRPRRSNLLAYALFANAVALLAIMVMLLARDRGPSMLPAAYGNDAMQAPPIAGGNGIYIMPCQLHPSVWGCYLMDTNRQTLCVYEYRAGTPSLVLTAARDYGYDVLLRNLDTFPAWFDVKREAEDAAKATQTNADKTPAGAQAPANNP